MVYKISLKRRSNSIFSFLTDMGHLLIVNAIKNTNTKIDTVNQAIFA